MTTPRRIATRRTSCEQQPHEHQQLPPPPAFCESGVKQRNSVCVFSLFPTNHFTQRQWYGQRALSTCGTPCLCDSSVCLCSVLARPLGLLAWACGGRGHVASSPWCVYVDREGWQQLLCKGACTRAFVCEGCFWVRCTAIGSSGVVQVVARACVSAVLLLVHLLCVCRRRCVFPPSLYGACCPTWCEHASM
jgi:hypothetical protein